MTRKTIALFAVVLIMAFLSVTPAALDTAAANDAEKELYTVREGDTLCGIAERYQLDAQALAKVNDIEQLDLLYAGTVLTIPAGGEFVYMINPGETISEIAAVFGDDISAITERNQLADNDFVVAGQTLLIAGDNTTGVQAGDAKSDDASEGETVAQQSGASQQRDEAADKQSASTTAGQENEVNEQAAAVDKAELACSWPVSGGYISSEFGMRDGRMHEGVDIAVVQGSVVEASMDGAVIFAEENGGYGLCVVVEHADGVKTLYAHNSQLLVREGEQVKQGRALALSGSTGNSTGPHVHFEIIIDGTAYNPLDYLPQVL